MSAPEFKPRTVNLTAVHFTAEHTDFKAALTEKLNHLPEGFFAGVGMVADLSAYPQRDGETLQKLKAAFAALKLSLVGVVQAECEDETLTQLGLARISPEKIRDGSAKPSRQSIEKAQEKVPHNTASQDKVAPSEAEKAAPLLPPSVNPSKIVRANVRSGQRIYAPSGDLIVIGAVGEGAEVIADGNIHILGTLRGRAFAGASGDVNSHIYVSDFAAELISIAGNYQNEEQLDRYKGGKNCLITLNKDETMLIVSL